MAQHLTATHAIVTELITKTDGRGHKLYMGNFFSFPNLFDGLATRQTLLWNGQTEQEGHTTISRTQEN
jgi:hypothetical protein